MTWLSARSSRRPIIRWDMQKMLNNKYKKNTPGTRYPGSRRKKSTFNKSIGSTKWPTSSTSNIYKNSYNRKPKGYKNYSYLKNHLYDWGTNMKRKSKSCPKRYKHNLRRSANSIPPFMTSEQQENKAKKSSSNLEIDLISLALKWLESKTSSLTSKRKMNNSKPKESQSLEELQSPLDNSLPDPNTKKSSTLLKNNSYAPSSQPLKLFKFYSTRSEMTHF